jgi:uncharacterized protein (DUF736 family)
VQQQLHPANPRIGVKKKMSAIGYVRRTGKGFEGNLNTPSIKSKVAIVTNAGKTNEGQPDYLVFVDGAEVGGAWIRQSRASGCDYVSLSIAAPEFGPRRLYANLGKDRVMVTSSPSSGIRSIDTIKAPLFPNSERRCPPVFPFLRA